MNKQSSFLASIGIVIILMTESNKAFTQSPPGYFGVNLSGAEFGSSLGIYGRDYSYPNEAELDYYKSKGFQLIRLPVKWERLQPVLGGPLDSAELNRLITVVDITHEKGIFIIPDLHNYGRRGINRVGYIIGTPKVSVNNIKQFWSELADVLKAKKNIWGYGLMNEPHDMLVTPTWFDIAQEIINGIREKDTSTSILVGGDHWSSAHKWMEASDNLKNLKDPANKLIFEAHVYFDKDNSGVYKNSYDVEETNPFTAVNRVKPFVSWLKANNLKGFLGEYGVPGNDARWMVALDSLMKYMKDNCINGTYWAGGPIWVNYPLSVEPENGKDRPQMKVLKNYLLLDLKKCSH